MAFDITGQLNLRLASGAVRNIANEINSGLRSSGVGAVNIPIKADTAALKSLNSQLESATSSVLKFAQQSGLALKRFAAFTLAAGPVIALSSAFRNAASEAMAFDKEMVRLRQVSMDVGGEVKSIGAEVTRLSVGLGVSSQDLIKTAVTLKQANLSINETKAALEALAKSALAPNFDSMAQTTEGAIAVMNQFKIESKDLEQALGSMNAVAGEFAVEAGDLIEVVRRTGGAFKASGGDLNELMAVFTSVRQTTRESAESIATGLRTIFTRLQRNETVSQLKSIGVNLRYTREEAEQMGNIKLTDQFVGAYEAVNRLSQALAQIPESDSRFASISEELGGYRQIGKVIPMLKEFAVSERALMVAEAGRISLQVNAAQAAESYGNKLAKLGESYASFGRSMMDTSGFKGAFSAFEGLAKSILGVLDAARPLLPLLSAIGAVKLSFGAMPFLREMVGGATYYNSSPVVPKKKFAAGGLVPGSGNTDSVPALLAPGSFVLRKSSTQKVMGYANGGKILDNSKLTEEALKIMREAGSKMYLGAEAAPGQDEFSRRPLSSEEQMGLIKTTNNNPTVKKYLLRQTNRAIKQGGFKNIIKKYVQNPKNIARYYDEYDNFEGIAGTFSPDEPKSINIYPRHGGDTLLHEMVHLLDFNAGDDFYKKNSKPFNDPRFRPLVSWPNQNQKVVQPNRKYLSENLLTNTGVNTLRISKLLNKTKINSGTEDYLLKPVEILAHLYANTHQKYKNQNDLIDVSKRTKDLSELYDISIDEKDSAKDTFNTKDLFNSQLNKNQKIAFEKLIRHSNKTFRKEIANVPDFKIDNSISSLSSLSKFSVGTLQSKRKKINRLPYDEADAKGTPIKSSFSLEKNNSSPQNIMDLVLKSINLRMNIEQKKMDYFFDKNSLSENDPNTKIFSDTIRDQAKNIYQEYQNLHARQLVKFLEDKPDISVPQAAKLAAKKIKGVSKGLIPNQNFLKAVIVNGLDAAFLDQDKNPYSKKAKGLVPGTGDTDSVFAPLEKDSFVLRKSAVNSLKKMATGGIVPAMVMPGEYIFSPQEASSIGYSTLSHLNSTGSLPGYAKGGRVTPTIKKLADELGLTDEELKNIDATGKRNYLTKSDIDNLVAEKAQAAKIIADYEKGQKKKQIIEQYKAAKSPPVVAAATPEYDFSSVVTPLYSEMEVVPADPGMIPDPDNIKILSTEKTSGNPRFAKGLSEEEMVRVGGARRVSSAGYEPQVLGPASWNMKQEEFPSDLGFKPGDIEARLLSMGREAGRGKAANAAFAAARAPEEAASMLAKEVAALEKEREIPSDLNFKEEGRLPLRSRDEGRGQISNAVFAAARAQEEAAAILMKEQRDSDKNFSSRRPKPISEQKYANNFGLRDFEGKIKRPKTKYVPLDDPSALDLREQDDEDYNNTFEPIDKTTSRTISTLNEAEIARYLSRSTKTQFGAFIKQELSNRFKSQGSEDLSSTVLDSMQQNALRFVDSNDIIDQNKSRYDAASGRASDIGRIKTLINRINSLQERSMVDSTASDDRDKDITSLYNLGYKVEKNEGIKDSIYTADLSGKFKINELIEPQLNQIQKELEAVAEIASEKIKEATITAKEAKENLKNVKISIQRDASGTVRPQLEGDDSKYGITPAFIPRLVPDRIPSVTPSKTRPKGLEEAEFDLNEYSVRLKAISDLPKILEKINDLNYFSNFDPKIKAERSALIDEANNKAKVVQKASGLRATGLIAEDGEKLSISEALKVDLENARKAYETLVDAAQGRVDSYREEVEAAAKAKKAADAAAKAAEEAANKRKSSLNPLDIKQFESYSRPADQYGQRLVNIAASKNEMGPIAQVSEAVDDSQKVKMLSEMSASSSTRSILEGAIYKAAYSSRPDLTARDRKALAEKESDRIFNSANASVGAENQAKAFEFQARQAQERISDIEKYKSLVGQKNALNKIDSPAAEQAKEMVESNLVAMMDKIKDSSGMNLLLEHDSENDKYKLPQEDENALNQLLDGYKVIVQTMNEQAKAFYEEAKQKAEAVKDISVSFEKDAYGVETVKFGGDASNFGAGPASPTTGAGGGLTLAQLRQDRVSDRMATIDPTGKGAGLSEITKAAIIEEETNKLRREYADGMAQIIMKEKQINSLEAARAIAIEEFNKNLHNNTLVTTKVDALGNKVVNANVAKKSSRPPSGSYGDLVAQEYENIIKKKDPRGKGLSDISKQKAMEEAELNIKSQYLQTTSRQVMQARGLSDINDALIVAEEMRLKAIDENAKVLRKGTKVYDKELYDTGSTGKASIKDMLRSGVESFKKNFLNLETAIAAVSVGASYLGDALSRSAGKAEDAVEGKNEVGFVSKRAMGGAATGLGAGAGSGAFAGYTVGGPGSTASMVLGTLGGVAGALTGFMSALQEAEIEISNVQIGNSIKKIDDYLRNFAKGTVNFDSDFLRQQESIIDKEQAQKARNQLSTMGIPFYSQTDFEAQIVNSRKETMAQQVPARMDALTKIIEDRAKKEIGNNANMNEESRKKAFEDVLMENGGFGRSQLGQIASATGQDINLLRGKMLDLFKRIADSEAIRTKQEQSTAKVNQSAVLFGNLNTALEISTQKLMEMSAASKNVTDVMDSNIGPFMGSGLASSLQQPFGAGREDFVNAIKTITSITGNGDDVVKQAEAATMAGTLLPGIIATIRSQPVANLAKGENFGIQVGDTLQKALTAKGMDQGISSSIVGMIQSQLGEEDFSKILRESGQDMSKMVDSLLKPIVEPLTRNSEKMSKMMDERAKDFADRIADIARRTRQKGEMIDAANDAEIAAVRNSIQTAAKRKEIPEFGAENDIFNLSLRQQQLRQSRLTNFGNGNAFPNQQAVADAQNPDKIFDAIQEVVAKIKKAERNVDELSKGKNVNASNQAITELTNLKTRAADLNQALKNLTDVSERNAAAQEKLGKIQNEREGRQSLGMRYATSNIEGRTEIARAFSLLNSAARMGTASQFTVRDQNQIFSLLSSLSPQMRLQGLGGATVKDITSQLLNTTFGGAFSLDPQTAAMERALENFVQQNYEVASRAAQLQVDNQTNLMSELFGRLENSQTKFLSELAKINKETADLMKQTLILRASEEVAKLEKGGGELSMLGNIGIKDNDQFEVLKALVKNPKINTDLKQIVTKRNEAASFDALLKDVSRPEMLDLFSKRINQDIGKEDLSTTKESSIGVIQRRLEEIGINNDLRQEVFERFKVALAEKGGGTFEGRAEDVKNALRETLERVIGGRAGGARLSADVSEKELSKNANNLDKNVIRQIALESEKQFGKLNFADLETAIKAVENFGGKFTDFTKELDAAKDRLKKLSEPEKKANGGLVRFFNKGGWGSGGSTTPHGADTVNARINPNEFVVAAGPAQRNKALLEKINAGGLVGMAEGGIVDEIYGSLNNAKSILSREGKMVGGEKEIEEAKRLARINSAAMFLLQLKDVPKDQREKLIDDQIKILKDGPTNPFQEGILDALNKVKGKREEQAAYEKRLKDFEDQKNAPAFQELLPEAEKVYDSTKASWLAFALKNNRFKINPPEKIVEEIPKILENFSGRYETNEKIYENSRDAIFNKTKKYLPVELTKHKKEIYQHFFDDLHKDVPDSIYQQFSSLDGINYTESNIKKWREKNVPRLIKGEKRNRQNLIDKIYGGDIEKHFEKNVWQSGISALPVDKQQFMADTNEVFKKIRNAGLDAPAAFDYEASIKALIEAQLEEVNKEKEKNFGMVKAKEGIEKDVRDRSKTFSTPQDKLNAAVGAVDPKQLGQGNMLEIIKAQNLMREAELFNQLNPAVQAKYLEPLKASIRKDGRLTDQQTKELGARFDLADKNLTAEEIALYARDKNKMSMLQRAFLELLMERVANNANGKKPEDLNEAEKYAYLIALESRAKTSAYDQVQDKKNRVGLNRMGQFLSANPGLIQARMSAAEDKGAEAYANEAALIEMVMSYFGTPTKIPSVFAVFKDKSLLGKKAGDAGVQPQKPGFFGANEAGEMGGKPMGPPAKADGGLIKFASGGLVPGVGNTDSVRANLPVGSYVIRKSSVNKLGADTLASLPHMAKGGVVPAMVMPGEHIFTPNEASKIGKGKLDYINQNGKLPGYYYGGDVPGGQPGGQKVNAQGAGVFGGGVPNQEGQWVFVPKGANPWAAGMPINQGAVQNKAMPFGANANAGAIPRHAGNQIAAEQEFQQAIVANNMNLDRVTLIRKKAEYYQLRNKLQASRNRSKEDVARFRELHAELTNPFVAQADAAQRMLSAQEALSKFEESPEKFLEEAKKLRKQMLDNKQDYGSRLYAKEMYEEYVLAARSIPPQVLRAAMAGKNNQPKNEILEREWAQRREAVAAHNRNMENVYGIQENGPEAVAAHNAAMEKKYGKKPTGPEAVAAHNAKMEEKYGKKISGPEAVKEHNAKVRAAEEARKEMLKKNPAPLTEIDKAIRARQDLKYEERKKAQGPNVKYSWLPNYKGPELHRVHAERKYAEAGDEVRVDLTGYNKLLESKFSDRIIDEPGISDKEKFIREYLADNSQFESKEPVQKSKFAMGMPTEIDKEIRRQKELNEVQKPGLTGADKAILEERARKEAELAKTKEQGGTEIDKAIRAARERKNADANLAKRAAGGIVPGVGSGDIVPAMLEPGELVVPKKHVQKFANGGIVGGIQGFANGGMAQGGPELLDVAAKFNQAATQISQGLSGFSTSVSTFNGAVANFGTFVDKFDEAVGKIPGQIELSGANEISVNLMGQDSIVKAVTEAIGPMIAEAIRANQPVEQRSQ
jgi:TP901 family phage tail tape measure protein